jgi:hypothetical protein
MAPREIESLPYVLRTTADGAQVLFDRRYRPIWIRAGVGRSAVGISPNAKVPYVTSVHLWCGTVNKQLMHDLQAFEKNFVLGREVKVPVRPFEHMFATKDKKPAAAKPIPTRPRLVVTNTSTR